MCYPLSSTTKRSGHQSFSRKRTHPVEGATSVDRRRRIRYKKSISKKSSPATTIDSDSDLGRFSYIQNLLVTPACMAWFFCAALKSPNHTLKTTFYSFECCAAPYTICAYKKAVYSFPGLTDHLNASHYLPTTPWGRQTLGNCRRPRAYVATTPRRGLDAESRIVKLLKQMSTLSPASR